MILYVLKNKIGGAVTVIQPTIAAEQEQKIRVAAYCRVSSYSADQLNSFMAQMRYYENFLADSETETLVSVYADEGVTGTRMDKREDFRRMLKDCRRGKIVPFLPDFQEYILPFLHILESIYSVMHLLCAVLFLLL